MGRRRDDDSDWDDEDERPRRRSRHRDDDSDEYESPRERTTRIKGGFGLGFFGSIGCVCGLVFLFCILPIGFLVSGGIAARQVAKEAERKKAGEVERRK